MSTISYIPIKSLKPSKLNVRKTGGKSVEDLAASIRAIGLQQNLGVLQNGKNYEVVFGNRRLRALLALAKAGELPESLAEGVPCNVLDDAAAHEASLAENTVREAMHPLDQFAAFAAMVNEGKPIVDVAAAFGVSELVVKQRMRLSSVSPKLQKAYGAGDMTLEQLQAFAVSNDHAEQERVWKAARSEWDRKPEALRRDLVKQGVSSESNIVRLVGLDNYLSAGGAVLEDLFSDTKVLLDELLLQQMAEAQVDKWIERLKGEGWSWVESGKAPTWNTRRIEPVVEAEEGITPAQEDAYELASENNDFAAMDAIEAAATQWPEGAHDAAGAMVTLHSHGLISAYRGMLRDDSDYNEAVDEDENEDGDDDASADQAPDLEQAPAQKIPGLLVADITGERTNVLRAAMNADPEKAFNLMLADMAGVWLEGHIWNGISGLHLHSRFQSRRNDAEEERATYWKKILSALPDRLSWITVQSMERRLELLAFLTSLQVDTVDAGSSRSCGQLIDYLNVDMSEKWRPNAEFFARIPAELIFQILTDIDVPNETIGALRKLKKKELAGRAAALVAPTRWLPNCLIPEQHS